MGTCKENTVGDDASVSWQQAQRVLEVLSSLSYQAHDLNSYLRQIASGVSQLVGLDWTVVTVCQSGQEKVMASSIDLGDGEHVYSLHGLLTNTVVQTGRSLAVDNAQQHPEYGKPPEGYVSYLGVPLRTPKGEILGTVCSFCNQPRSFSADEVRTVELFAERAATAIDNFRLYQQQCQFNETLEAEVAKRTEELQVAQARLIEQERLAAVGQFAAMIVHEIRNPMTTIRMGLHYFKRTRLAEADQERLALSLDELARLENLLNEILLYAKPQVLQLTEIDLNDLLISVLQPFQETPEAETKSIQVTPSQAAAIVLGDRDKLKQVFINLFRNACEAIEPGEVVTCSTDLSTDKTQVQVQIRNGGAPIPPDILPQLTQPFCSTKPEGTGLGLAIVKRIIDAHSGTLTIQSTADIGTTVSLSLPLADARMN